LEKEIGAIDAVAKAVDRLRNKGRFVEFELSNGIVLRIKPVPPLLIQGVTREFQTPEPPKVYIQDQDRYEENPSDPAYLKQVNDLVEEQNIALVNLTLAMGTEIASVPEGRYPPQAKEWEEQVKFAAEIIGKPLDIPPEGIKRYLCWLRFYALETNEDFILCNNLPMQVGGIRDEEVEEIIEFFRSLSQRGANREGPTEIGNQNGNQPNRASRRAGQRTRGA
jgi:hypothetical protein